MNNLEKLNNIKNKEELKNLIDKYRSFKEEFLKDYLGEEMFITILNSGIDLDDIEVNL